MREQTEAGKRLARKVADNDRLMKALTGVMDEIDKRNGEECWRHSYDKALHIRGALRDAGFKIVNDPKWKAGENPRPYRI